MNNIIIESSKVLLPTKNYITCIKMNFKTICSIE